MGESSEIQALLTLQPFESVFDPSDSTIGLSVVTASSFVAGGGGSRSSGKRSVAPAGLLHQFRINDGKTRRRKKKGDAAEPNAIQDSSKGNMIAASRPPAAYHLQWQLQDAPSKPAPQLLSLESLDSQIDPFDSLPSFASANICRTDRMLYHFRQRYGHLHSSPLWQDAMFSDRLACLSFLNIAVMATHCRQAADTPAVQTLSARFETIRLLNASLRAKNLSNFTIMSLNHMLVSELCAADRPTIEAHIRGSERAIAVRGGFELMDRIGPLDRECAARNQYSILTGCAMYEIAPSPEVLAYMPSSVPVVFNMATKDGVMESPIYHDIDAPLVPEVAEDQPERLLLILFAARMLTDMLLEEADREMYGRGERSEGHRLQNESMNSIFADLLSQPSANEFGHEITGNLLYEAVRLVGLIYATAILYDVPFSQAASMPPLRLKEPEILERMTLVFKLIAETPVFDEYLGVALWATLVACAACGGNSFIQNTCIDDATGTFKPLPMKFFEAFYSQHHVACVRSLKTLCRVQAALGQPMHTENLFENENSDRSTPFSTSHSSDSQRDSISPKTQTIFPQR